ncbi:MAG: hypothetical protein M3H12_08135 [Chromatiales bacterium]|nr:hypothetical protein [Gammaproteobacteria bacterium]
MKTKNKGIKRLLVVLITILTLSIFSMNVYAGQYTNTKIDFSELKPDKWMTLTFNPATRATLGIRSNIIKGGFIYINEYNYIATDGAGIYAGTKETKWPKATAYFVTSMESSSGILFNYIGINRVCTNLYYEGVVTGGVDLKLPNGNINKLFVAKPTIGMVEKCIAPEYPEENIFDIDRDFGDGVIESSKYGKVEVFIVATVENVQFIFVVDKKRLTE